MDLTKGVRPKGSDSIGLAPVEAMIARLAEGKALLADVVQHIVAKTDGVPLYVEELTKMLLESDLLRGLSRAGRDTA